MTEPLKFTDEQSDKLLFVTRTGIRLLLSDDLYPGFNENNFEKLQQDVLDSLIKAEAIIPADQNELYFILSERKKTIQDTDLLNIVVQPGA